MDAPVRRNEFQIVGGDDAGTVLRIPPGHVAIGSGEDANIQLAFPGVSRLHAWLAPVKQRTIISDNGSKRGTWVNGQRISAPTEIVDGDLLQFGSVRVRFREGSVAVGPLPPTGDERRIKQAGKRREPVGAAVLLASLINLVGLVGNGAAALLTDLTPTWSWFIAPVIGLVVAIATELVGYYRQSSDPRPGRLVATVLVAILLLGGGGWALTAGVSAAVGYFSGNEAGVQRLEGPAGREVQGVNISVLSVLSTPNFTRVEILVRNQTGVSITMPLLRNCSLTAAGGITLDADPVRSSWGTDIAPGGQRKGTINFPGQIPEERGAVTLRFSTIYGAGINIPRSITIPNIILAPEAGYSAR